jgi:hypothetical protein
MSSVTFSTTVGGDGSTVTDDDDATTGLRNGGWRTRFVPALTQEVAVAGNAVASATAALSSKNAAAASASTATTQASNASTSATNAASSATAAAASYDSFDDRYLGAKTSDPSVDNDGNALLTGALYWNSATGVFKVWSGSAWITNITSNQFGTNVATFLQTPSSANLAAALTDKTGTGANVFANAPTFPAQINLTANSGYNIYASGTADNYLAGSLGIGNGANPYDKVLIGGTLPSNSTVSRALEITATCPSTSTGEISGFLSQLTTQATSFNCANMRHFVAVQNTLGAGSTVSNQYGIQIDNSLADAVNNYGFYGGINKATGTTRYNLYMAGSADNYLAGSLGIGTYPCVSNKLDVLGTIGFNSAGTSAGRLNTYTLGVSDDNTVGQKATIGFAGAGTNGYLTNIIFSNFSGDYYNAPLVERMRIDTNGNIGIGTASPNASAILDVQSTGKGVRMPNMTTTQKNAIASPAAGLMVFDTDLAKLCVYTGAAWQTITSV